MKIKYLLLVVSTVVLSACSLSLSPEKAATTTISPQDIIEESQDKPSVSSDQVSPTTTPDPLDDTDISDQELLNILDDIDSDLDLDSDFQDLDKQLN